MALGRSRRGDSGFNYWPGFVDALSTLILAIVFLLSVFTVVQFFLSQQVTSKDKLLEQLNAQIDAAERPACRMEKLGKLSLDGPAVADARRPLRRGRRARPAQGSL